MSTLFIEEGRLSERSEGLGVEESVELLRNVVSGEI